MKINNVAVNLITVNNYKKKDNPTSFKGKEIEFLIKDIPGTHCACCGRELIPARFMKDFWIKITTPFIKSISNEYFEGLRISAPGLWRVLNRFANLYPNDSLDTILRDNDTYSEVSKELTDYVYCCKHDDTKTLNISIKKEFSRMRHFGRLELRDLKSVVREIEPYEHLYTGTQKKVYDELKKLSVKYGDKGVSEALRQPEVFRHYIPKALEDVKDIASRRDACLDKVSKLILKNKPDAGKDIHDKLERYVQTCYLNEQIPRIFLHKLINKYTKYLEENNLLNIKEEVINELQNLPVNILTSNMKLARARTRSDDTLVEYIIKQNTTALGRIFSITDRFDNRLLFCDDCSAINCLGDLYFNELYYPELKGNIQKQLQYISNQVLVGNASYRIRTFPFEIAITLEHYSNGRFAPDLTQCAKDALLKTKELSKSPYGEQKFRKFLLDYIDSHVK